MNSFVRTNIRHSMQRELIPLDLNEYMQVEPEGSWKQDSERIPEFIYGPLPQHPWFYVDEQRRFRSCQEEYFGFYAMGTMIRSVLRSAGFLVAGDQILPHLYSPAILCYYTSAFHTLTAFLASEGRVLIEPVRGTPLIKVHDKASSFGFSELGAERGTAKVICAILTRDNRWIFEGRSRSHNSRWKELLQVERIRKKQPPKPIVGIADYLSTHGGEPLCLPDEVLEFGIGCIPGIRHAATYQGYGVDDFALELGMNMGITGGTHLRRENMGVFARSWLNEVLTDTATLLSELKGQMDDLRKAMLRLNCQSPIEYGALGERARLAYEEVIGFVYGLDDKK